MTPTGLAWEEGRVEDLLTLAAEAPGDVTAQARRAWVLWVAGAGAEADRVSAEARRTAEALGPEAVYEAIDGAAGHADVRAPALEHALRLATEVGIPEHRVARTRARLARVRIDLGELRVARETLGPERDEWWWWDAYAHLAMFTSEAEPALAAFERVVALTRAGRRPDEVAACANALARTGTLRFAKGDLDGAQRANEAAIDHIGPRPWMRIARALAWSGMGEVHRWRGDLDAAERAYARAAREAPEIQMWAVNLAIVDLERGRYAEAAAAVAALRDPKWTDRGPIALVRAGCAAAAGDGAAFDEATTRLLADARTRTAIDPDLARLSRLAGALAERHHGWWARAARIRSLALATWTAFGRTREATEEQRALRRLADQGAPTQLGSFALERRVGRGGFGVVWSARDATGAPVAIKVFGRGTPVEALERELRAVAALDHPHVVRLLDHGRVDVGAATMEPTLGIGMPWMATELFEGTLDPLLGRAPWDTVRRVLLDLLDALAHAHARGLLHLDVKPANVLVRGERTCLADFGLARAVGAEGTTAGTPLWMAPEQFTGGRMGPWTDLYALGCLSVALVGGRPPFDAASVQDLRRAHLSAPPAIAPVVPVPEGFLPWVRRLLAKAPSDRFRQAADAARALHALGPARGEASAPPPRQESGCSTIPLDALADELPLAAARDDERVAPVPPPVVPARWDPAASTQAASHGGLALFGWRTVPLLARRAERDRLWTLLREVVATGEPRAATLRGPSGFGASALARWCCERAAEVGAADAVAVLGPGVALWRALAVALDPAGPVVREALAEPPVLGPLERRRVVVRHLAARGRPVVLWLDGPALDADALGLVTDLLATRAPVLVLVAGPTDRKIGVDIELGPLDADETRELLLALLPFVPATLARLTEVVGGDPRFAVQLVTDLVDRDRVDVGPGGVHLRPGVALPSTLAQHRVERVRSLLYALASADRDALAVAAVLGPTVEDATWAAACRHAGLPFAAAGRDALVSARLARMGRGEWTISEGLREALLGPADARALHQACAQALRERGHDLARVGAHEEAAGRRAEAFAAYREAMFERSRSGQEAEAEALVARVVALELPEPLATSARVAIARVRARPFLRAGRFDEVTARMRTAAGEAERAGLTEDAQDAWLNVVVTSRLTGRALGGEVEERLQAIARDPASPRVRLRTLYERARLAEGADRHDEAGALYEEGVALAEAVRGPEAQWLHHGLGWHVARLGHLEEALAWLVRARDGQDGAVNRTIARRSVAIVLLALGRLDEAERELVVAEETVEAVGQSAYAAVVRMDRALLRYAAGRDAEGDALAEIAVDGADLRQIEGADQVHAAMELVRCAPGADGPFEAALARAAALRLDATPLTGPIALAAAARRAEAAGRPDRTERIGAGLRARSGTP